MHSLRDRRATVCMHATNPSLTSMDCYRVCVGPQVAQ